MCGEWCGFPVWSLLVLVLDPCSTSCSTLSTLPCSLFCFKFALLFSASVVTVLHPISEHRLERYMTASYMTADYASLSARGASFFFLSASLSSRCLWPHAPEHPRTWQPPPQSSAVNLTLQRFSQPSGLWKPRAGLRERGMLSLEKIHAAALVLRPQKASRFATAENFSLPVKIFDECGAFSRIPATHAARRSGRALLLSSKSPLDFSQCTRHERSQKHLLMVDQLSVSVSESVSVSV